MNTQIVRWKAALVLLAVAGTAVAQTVLPLPDPRFEGDVGRTYKESDPAPYPAPVRAPKGAPNMVVILLDDVGFGQFSAFGGGVPGPAMEQLARQGVRYNRFHTAGICSPTRAALLTGRNPHTAGFGLVGELATGYDGYVGAIPRSTASVAEVLRQHGYATAMFGKNHNTPSWEGGPAGPFNHWPTGNLGFDYFYGFNGWGTSQWQPVLYENTRPVPPSTDPNYHLTPDLVNHAIDWMRAVKSTDAEKPFLLYMATGATHAPHHAPQSWVEQFKGKFDQGWDRYREEAFARQKALGVVPADAKLSPRPANIPAWDSLSPEQQRLFAHQMEVFAAFGAYTDHEVGRLLDAVRAMPDADNTLVVYIVGDNGASAEGGPVGEINEIAPANGLHAEGAFTPEVVQALGGPKYNNNYPMGWAWAMSTPFPYYKQIVSHLGAVRNPLIVSWPKRIKPDGQIRSQFHHVIDIAPTLLEAAGIESPSSVNGVAQKPVDGVSMLPTFTNAQAPERRLTQHFEVFANRGIYHKGWFASAPLSLSPSNPNRSSLDPDKVTWELYDLTHDFSQSTNVANEHPAELRRLQDLWWAKAGAHDVLPLDWRAGERLVSSARPNPAKGRQHFDFYPGMIGLPETIAPNIKNRSWKIAAKGSFTRQTSGMLITQGGMTGGWAFYVQDGKLVFDYNYSEYSWYRVVSSRPLPAQGSVLEVRFAYDGKTGKDFGAGGTVSLWADGAKVGEGRLDKTLSGLFSITDGMDVGADYGSPVSDHYAVPFPFSGGKLHSVAIDLVP